MRRTALPKLPWRCAPLYGNFVSAYTAGDRGVKSKKLRPFFDDQAIVFFDPDHSDEEDRFLLLGTSYKLNQLVVCHCFREEETKVRIISARKADKDEANAYWENRK